MRKGYDTDLSNAEWELIRRKLPRRKKRGRPREIPFREIINGIMYVSRSGCQWHLLPKDFPAFRTVYHYFNLWVGSGLWESMAQKLTRDVRHAAGRQETPSAVIIDSQSVKSSRTCEDSGFDGGKKITGRKRHVMVDVLGLIIAVCVTGANVTDRDGASTNFLNAEDRLPRLEKVWADGSFSGTRFSDFAFDLAGWDVEVIKPRKVGEPGFHVRPWCWIVERTFGWLMQFRRLTREYERTEAASESQIHISMIRLMLKRLVNSGGST